MTRHSKEKHLEAEPRTLLDPRLRVAGAAILILLIAFLLVKGFMAPLHLADADIGRHIKNGELVVTQGVLPTTNYYSYTQAEYPVINHHWASGVLFYLLYRQGSFTLLSWSYVAILFGAAMILFLMSVRTHGAPCASAAFLALWPLITFRLEIRPEGFSYLLCALFSLILWLVVIRRRPARLLIALPVLTVLWVNLHIYFIMGLFILGVYMTAALLELFAFRRWGGESAMVRRLAPLIHCRDAADAWRISRALILAFAASSLATLINPNGFKGALEPFLIFREYGYLLVENQSIWFLHRVLPLPQLGLFEAMAVLVAAITCLALWRAFRRKIAIDLAQHVLALTFTVMGALALRNFTLMGLYTAPVLASSLWILVPAASAPGRQKARVKRPLARWAPLAVALFATLFVVLWHADLWRKRWENSSITLVAGGPGAIEFFVREKLHGPIFNNYDIGGLLILGLFPKERVFVDNRPEAYPADFFQNLYIPMQQDDQKWQEARGRFGFNAIVFGYRDLTPWGQTFLQKRLDDPAWAPVYADLSTMIFVPNDEAHRPVIEKYRLPRDMFGRKHGA